MDRDSLIFLFCGFAKLTEKLATSEWKIVLSDEILIKKLFNKEFLVIQKNLLDKNHSSKFVVLRGC